MEKFIYLTFSITLVALAAQIPKAPVPPPPEFDDLRVPTAEQGKSIPVVFGTLRLTSPNVLWYGNLRYSSIKTKSGK